LSNTNEAHIENVRAYLKAERAVDDFEDRYFDTVFYSYEMKMRKPNDNIYEEVIQSAGIDLGNMVFFDDNELNIETAKKLGWNAVLHPIGAEITEAVAKVLT
jgi:Predicted hydrolase (HAD superfamily)